MSEINRSWVEIAEADWTEDIRALTRSVSLAGAARNAAGNVIADLDLADADPLPAPVTAVTIKRRTHAEQTAKTIHEAVSAMPEDHLRWQAKIIGAADWDSALSAALVTEVMNGNLGEGLWSIVEAPPKKGG